MLNKQFTCHRHIFNWLKNTNLLRNLAFCLIVQWINRIRSVGEKYAKKTEFNYFNFLGFFFFDFSFLNSSDIFTPVWQFHLILLFLLLCWSDFFINVHACSFQIHDNNYIVSKVKDSMANEMVRMKKSTMNCIYICSK